MENLPKDYFVTSQQFTKHTFRDIYPSIDPKSPALSQGGKIVVITGASRGIGSQGLVPSFARAGAKAIILVARDLEKLKSVETEMKESYPDVQVLSVPADISDLGSVNALFEKIKDSYGQANVLINNAGVLKATGSVKDVDATAWWDEFALNARGTFLVTQKFLQLLPSTSRGNVINMVTGAAFNVFPGLSAYSLSKLVALQLTAYVAAENPNVAAMALHPGILKTDMTVEDFIPFADDTPQLVGGVAVWLCTENARFLNGRYISANWSIDDLLERKEEIESGNKLKVDLQGTFGIEQFK